MRPPPSRSSGKSKFARGNKTDVKTFDDFADNCAHEWNPHYQGKIIDRAADDTYLRRIVNSRGAVKHQAINDPQTKRAIDYRVQLAVGTSVRIKPIPFWNRLGWSEKQNREFRREVKQLWKMYMESDRNWIDVGGRHNVSQLAALHTRIYEQEGEAFAGVYELGANRRSPLSFAIGNIDPDRIRNPHDKQTVDDFDIRDGILESRQSFPLGYYVHDYHRRDSRAQVADTDTYRFVRPRNRKTGRLQIMHSYLQQSSDLSRGISSLASSLMLSEQKDKYLQATLEDAISKAGLTFVVKSNAKNLNELMGVLSNQNKDSLKDYMTRSKQWHKSLDLRHKGNKIARLLHGEDIEGFSADQAGGATMETFYEIIDSIAASAHGLSVEEYRQRWNDTNYSGARAGKLYVWNMIKALRAQAPYHFLRKCYELFMDDMILQGKLALPNTAAGLDSYVVYKAHEEELNQVEFFGSPKDEIDRAKTADGYLAEGQMGVGTWESYCNEVLDEDWDDRLDQIIEEVQTTWEKLDAAGSTPDWTVQQMVTQRLFAGNAFLARKELRQNGAIQPEETEKQTG